MAKVSRRLFAPSVGRDKFTAKLADVTHKQSTSRITPKTSLQTALYAATADTVLVLLFAISGRSSHAEGLTAVGVFETGWPFLGALAIGWLVCQTWRRPLRIWPQAVCLWLITVAAGMVLRIASGSTAELPFVIVATLVLGLFLLGHRFLATLVKRRVAKS